MIGLWLILAAWTAWAAQVGLGDWLIVRAAGRRRWLRAVPSHKALLGLSDRWVIDERLWLRYAHERVALGMASRRGRTMELPLDGHPVAIAPNLIIEERWRFSIKERRRTTAR